MKKITKYLSVTTSLFVGFFLFLSKAYADLLPLNPDGTSPDNSQKQSNTLIIEIGVVVVLVALVSWLVIRAVKNKKNVNHK